MTSLIQYVSRILIISLPAVVVFLCFMPYRMRALKAMNLHSGWQREIGLILFVVSIFGILALTLWPTYIWEDSPGIWGDIRILIDRPAWNSSLSVVPFSVFKDYYEDLLKSPVFFFVTLINFFGNLAMFIPIGFFSALLFRNATLKRSAIIGFGMSTFIESAQYFIMRNTAVDDIILNTVKILSENPDVLSKYQDKFRYILVDEYRLLRKMFPGFSRKFICNITQAAGN